MKEPEFNLDQVREYTKLTESLTIRPFQTVRASGITECRQHFKRVNMIVENDPNKNYEAAVPIHGYTVLRLGSSRVSIGIQNLSCRQVTIPAKSAFAKIAAADIVPHSYPPNIEDKDPSHKGPKNCQQQPIDAELDETNSRMAPTQPALAPEIESLLFSKIDLDGAKGWDEELKVKTQDLF